MKSPLDRRSLAVALAFVFALGLDGPSWYHVAASLTGPLSGMAPSGATQNPSALVGVGDGDPELDLSFD